MSGKRGCMRVFDSSNLAGPRCQPIVTVAVPSLNQGGFLDATLRSIFSQPVPVEVMLADGGSTDDTSRVIARWQHRFTWWRSAPDKGQAAGINEAIARGRAPYVCWMNSDDLFLPGGLAALLQTLEAKPGTAVAHGGCRLIDESGDLIGLLRGKVVSARSLSRSPVIPQPASLIRREAWNKVKGLKEDLHLSLDYDLWWRLYRFRLSVYQNRFRGRSRALSSRRKVVQKTARDVRRGKIGGVQPLWFAADVLAHKGAIFN